MSLQEKYKTLMNSYCVNTKLRIAHFITQIEHESGLKPISENLSYSRLGLLNTFSKYFTDDILDKDGTIKVIGTARKYARQPEKIANRVYANRMGNGDEQSEDGWKYRGRGFIQITGKENYLKLTQDTNIDFFNNPDLLLIEANAMLSALWFWNLKGLNKLADKNDVVGITKKINGGLNGIEHRKELLKKYMS